MTDVMKIIREERKKQGLSQEKLAYLAQVNPVSIHFWETYKFSPKLDIVINLLDALGLEIIIQRKGHNKESEPESDNNNEIPTIEPNRILPEQMKRGDIYEVGETIVVMNHDDYYDLLCKSWMPKRGVWQYVYKGKWIFRRCSCCEWTQTYDDSKYMGYRYNFCPNCGADMRKGADDDNA